MTRTTILDVLHARTKHIVKKITDATANAQAILQVKSGAPGQSVCFCDELMVNGENAKIQALNAAKNGLQGISDKIEQLISKSGLADSTSSTMEDLNNGFASEHIASADQPAYTDAILSYQRLSSTIDGLSEAPAHTFLSGDDAVKLFMCEEAAQKVQSLDKELTGMEDTRRKFEQQMQYDYPPARPDQAMGIRNLSDIAMRDTATALGNAKSDFCHKITKDYKPTGADNRAAKRSDRPVALDLLINAVPFVGTGDQAAGALTDFQRGNYAASAAGLFWAGMSAVPDVGLALKGLKATDQLATEVVGLGKGIGDAEEIGKSASGFGGLDDKAAADIQEADKLSSPQPAAGDKAATDQPSTPTANRTEPAAPGSEPIKPGQLVETRPSVVRVLRKCVAGCK